jgi:uncharacterized protein (DUF2235 family)
MKRLVFCFDGSWNTLDAPYQTNVVITAESATSYAPDGTAQVIFYDEGVGTAKGQKFRGGIFGKGVIENLSDGYRFLIFNYKPGDEIFVFGFSRGAYTARSFVGLLSTCGILLPREASRATEAIELYQERDLSEAFKAKAMRFRSQYSAQVCVSDEENTWRIRNMAGYEAKPAHRLQVSYVGVWDTVGSLGVPARYFIARWTNREHRFHDPSLSPFVKSARHAVAIDERRKDFAPTLWDNIDELNTGLGKSSGDADAPYQQMWFPGVHGAVGGGGERRGLSDLALDWLLDGARGAGLVLEAGEHSRIFELAPDYRDYLNNQEKSGLFYRALNKVASADREGGPKHLYEVSMSARRRWLERPENLADRFQYRPKTLAAVEAQLNTLDPAAYGLGQDGAIDPAMYDTYVVKRNQNLYRIAQEVYGDGKQWERIWKANLHKIDNPDRIYPGQLLRIPRNPQP